MPCAWASASSGAIANNVGSPRHADILRQALERANLPPLFGALPRREEWRLPERQLGLLPSEEAGTTAAWLDALAEMAEQHLDIDRLLALTTSKRPEAPAPLPSGNSPATGVWASPKTRPFASIMRKTNAFYVRRDGNPFPFPARGYGLADRH